MKYLVLLLLVMLPEATFASVVYSDNFDSYSTGAIVGNGTWVAKVGTGAGYNVSTTQAQSGTKSVAALNNINGTQSVKGTFTAISSGTPMFTYYFFNNTTATQAAYTGIEDSGGNGWYVLTRTNNTFLFSDTNFTNLVDNQFSWTASTWTQIDIQVDLANNQARFRVNGGTWSSYVVHSSTSVTSISQVELFQGANSAGTSYWDTISVDNGITPVVSAPNSILAAILQARWW